MTSDPFKLVLGMRRGSSREDLVEPTVRLHHDATLMLMEIAEKNQISIKTALEQVIFNEDFLTREEAEGSRLYIAKGTDIRQLIRTT